MRYRVDEYRIWVYNTVIVAIKNLPSDITLEKQSGSDELTTASARKVTEALRLVIDETAGEVFCSSMQKSKVKKCYGSGTYQSYSYAFYIEFDIPAGKTIDNTDQFTIEMDWGDALGDCAAVLDYIVSGGLPTITAIAKQGSDASANISDIQTNLGILASNVSTDLSIIKGAVKDGNDTAISVSKEVRSEVGTGSDTAAETGTLFAVVKWVKDKVKSIFNYIGTPASGQPSTLFAAIAAGGASGGTVYQTEQMTATTASIDPNKVYIWGEVASLDISLNAGEAGVANVYFLEFYSGATATTLTLPASVTEVRGVVQTDSIVNVGIFNGIAYII